jgi:hypothetical protein
MALNTTDSTWDNVPTSYWSVIELNTGILCACLPTLRPLLRKFTGGLSGNSSRDYPHHHHHHSKEGGGGTGGNSSGGGSAAKHPPGGFSLSDFKRSSSQEGLKDEEGEAGSSAGGGHVMYYEPAEYARHSGKVSKLSTAIVGRRAESRPSDDGSISEGQQRIKVTREIMSREVLRVPQR